MLEIDVPTKYINLFASFSIIVMLFYTIPSPVFMVLCMAFVMIVMYMMNNPRIEIHSIKKRDDHNSDDDSTDDSDYDSDTGEFEKKTGKNKETDNVPMNQSNE
nr:hypothetical protein MmNV_47 [Menippe mercenaria nudivirus]